MDHKNITVPWPDWKIIRRIGKGSFGEVFEIERENYGVTEKSALKVIRVPSDPSESEELIGEGYDKSSLRSFYGGHVKSIETEYQLMNAVGAHPNIVSCLDYKEVEHEDGIGWDIFIRMELLTPLQKYLQDEVFLEEDVIQLGKDLCKALIACEFKEIVHRDIKPGNIMVSRIGDFCAFKLGDFGVARVMDHTTHATKAGAELYMAPEVIKREEYGRDVDIYSLGLVMYWLLNNRRMPFLPADRLPTAEEKNDAHYKRVNGEPIPAPIHGSEALQRIVLKACAYHKKDRYQSAKEMLEDLEKGSADDWEIEYEPVSPEVVLSQEEALQGCVKTISITETRKNHGKVIQQVDHPVQVTIDPGFHEEVIKVPFRGEMILVTVVIKKEDSPEEPFEEWLSDGIDDGTIGIGSINFEPKTTTVDLTWEEALQGCTKTIHVKVWGYRKGVYFNGVMPVKIKISAGFKEKSLKVKVPFSKEELTVILNYEKVDITPREFMISLTRVEALQGCEKTIAITEKRSRQGKINHEENHLLKVTIEPGFHGGTIEVPFLGETLLVKTEIKEEPEGKEDKDNPPRTVSMGIMSEIANINIEKQVNNRGLSPEYPIKKILSLEEAEKGQIISYRITDPEKGEEFEVPVQIPAGVGHYELLKTSMRRGNLYVAVYLPCPNRTVSGFLWKAGLAYIVIMFLILYANYNLKALGVHVGIGFVITIIGTYMTSERHKFIEYSKKFCAEYYEKNKERF